MEPTASFQCTATAECSQIDLVNTPSPMVHEQGKCSALLTREGLFDFFIFKTQCNIPYNVAVVCQHNKVSSVFSNNMSDIKLSLFNKFHSIRLFSSCDPGWFKVDDVCINFYPCHNCSYTYCKKKSCCITCTVSKAWRTVSLPFTKKRDIQYTRKHKTFIF